jgi:mercuric ion transport protein
MAHFVETPPDTSHVETATKPSRTVERAGLSVTVRLARGSYALLSSAFVAGVLVQVFFAGMGAFGADWSYHLTFVHLLEPVPLLMVPVAFVGRLPWGLRLLPLALVFLIGVQYAFASATVPAAALHPVNGFLILLTSLLIARRAWTTVRRKG